jgi:ubiquinone/menaquinone biosynthesis C-methylase UbiE
MTAEMSNLKVKEQFDRQALRFDAWPVTRNEKILGSLYNFFGIEESDRLLDVACGTGAFALYAAGKTRQVRGVDISEGMVKVAEEAAKEQGADNLKFVRCDVETLPFLDGCFDSVVSKSAFHHMKNFGTVFQEMQRCCAPGGRICLEDIVLYGDAKVDDFFERLEIEIDGCHHRSLSRSGIIDLYRGNGVEVTRLFESVSELGFLDYIEHAFQDETAQQRIATMVEDGMQDADIAHCFSIKDGILYWKRKVLTITGRKSS